MSIATQLTPVNDQASQPVIDGMAQAATASPEESRFEQIRPDFIRGCNIIAGAAKLIEAKAALRKNKGSFVRLVEKLGLDLDKAERFMNIAAIPCSCDSAHARNLPLSWMTLYTLAALPPKVLESFIAGGTVHPGLERKQAERLVRKVRGSNSRRSSRSGPRSGPRSGSRRDHGAGRDDDRVDHAHGGDRDLGGDRDANGTRDAQTGVQDDTIGPNSRANSTAS